MTSKERLLAALNHKEGDRTPVDFGGTTVTGMHYSCVAALRDYYGLEKRTIKVYEPYQMLGLIEEDLKAALGLDVEGVGGRRNMFGIPNENWKEWKQDNGDVVLVAGDFNVTDDEEGNHYIHPLGDRSVAPSGKMPKGGLYFDAVSRQVPFDDIDDWNPDDNLEEFTYTTDEVLDEFTEDLSVAAKTGRGVAVSFGGTALGDIALVPGLNLKNPKGVRDVAEWYMATATAPEYVKYIFDKQTDIALENLKRLNEKPATRLTLHSSAEPISEHRFQPSVRPIPSVISTCRTIKRSTTGFTKIPIGKPSSTAAVRWNPSFRSLLKRALIF